MTINRTNTASTLEKMVVGFDEARRDIADLTNVVEFLVVAMKKTLGADADRLLKDIDAIRASSETVIIEPIQPGSYENEIGAVFSDRRDSARVD